jgi:hypothetical protein
MVAELIEERVCALSNYGRECKIAGVSEVRGLPGWVIRGASRTFRVRVGASKRSDE